MIQRGKISWLWIHYSIIPNSHTSYPSTGCTCFYLPWYLQIIRWFQAVQLPFQARGSLSPNSAKECRGPGRDGRGCGNLSCSPAPLLSPTRLPEAGWAPPLGYFCSSLQRLLQASGTTHIHQPSPLHSSDSSTFRSRDSNIDLLVLDSGTIPWVFPTWTHISVIPLASPWKMAVLYCPHANGYQNSPGPDLLDGKDKSTGPRSDTRKSFG